MIRYVVSRLYANTKLFNFTFYCHEIYCWIFLNVFISYFLGHSDKSLKPCSTFSDLQHFIKKVWEFFSYGLIFTFIPCHCNIFCCNFVDKMLYMLGVPLQMVLFPPLCIRVFRWFLSIRNITLSVKGHPICISKQILYGGIFGILYFWFFLGNT